MQEHTNGNVDAWVQAFQAAYDDVKRQFEGLKGEVRGVYKRLRVEATIGDPQKAADEAGADIRWMRGVESTLQEGIKRPKAENEESM